MLCPKCQHRNPDENRFCGQCGCDLAKSAPTIYPREGYDEGDLPSVSEVEPEIPRFRRDVPPLSQSEYGPPADVPRVTPASEPSPASTETRTPVKETSSSSKSQEDLSSFGGSNSILFSVDPKRSVPTEPLRETPGEPEEGKRSQGIHGPSFLGLAEAGDPDFLDDLDEPRSHARRNWFLFALALIAVLAFAEWRNIRSSGLDFAGVMKLSLPHKKGEQPKPAENAATDAHSESGPANNGQPEITVNPLNSNTGNQKPAQADNTLLDSNGNAQQNSANSSAAQQGSGSAADQEGGAQQAGAAGTAQNPDKSKATNDKNSTNGQKPGTEPTKNTPPDSAKADNSGADDSGASASGTADKTKRSAPAKSVAKRSHGAAEPKASPGDAELARAESASSPETAAKWLWASTSKGNLDAPVRLADMYANGRGVPKDCEQATVLLRSSARRGNPRAAARLGMYYATGLCVQQDRSQAWHWLALAHQKDPNSDWITQYRQRLWSEMSAQERARAGNGPTARASE